MFDQPNYLSQFVQPFLHTSAEPISGLDHSWQGMHAAWNGGNYDAWVKAKGPGSMCHLDRTRIPYHFALADAFTICDHYFCSAMSSTNPNRLFLWSGTCDPNGDFGGPVIDNSASGFRWTTYPERLQAASVDWKIYQNAADNFDDNALAWFSKFKNAKPGSLLHARGMASVPAVSGDTCADIVTAIENDVQSGTLPFASWIIAPESCSEHPSHSPNNGAAFISGVLGALMSNPDTWASTVLLINYDENDGFFDHIPPPTPPVGTENEFIDGNPIGLGPRVPMLVVSPWSRGGHVCSQVFDHTSVIRFMESLTGVAEPNISRWRRRVCGDLMSAFDFATSVYVNNPFVESGGETGIPVQRQKRKLPYRPNAQIEVEPDRGLITIGLTNEGSESTHFAAFTPDSNDVRQYDVSATDGQVKDSFQLVGHQSGFAITIYGPNGFLRRFSTDRRRSDIAIISSFELVGESIEFLHLTLKNLSNRDLAATIIDNSNSGSSKKSLVLANNSCSEISLAANDSGRHEYDFSVSIDADAYLEWRFAG